MVIRRSFDRAVREVERYDFRAKTLFLAFSLEGFIQKRIRSKRRIKEHKKNKKLK